MATRRSDGGVHRRRRGRASRYDGGALEMATAANLDLKVTAGAGGDDKTELWRGAPIVEGRASRYDGGMLEMAVALGRVDGDGGG
ncbi:hypothetical protein E2562_034125 [Oryza meyeriana var. granulata]|uniref:Uncharacterized protein n=1 Tax=Oryza meyeriana var. granulata TaxID=110450 RepID=A0A6G1E6U0_9ORYZ|nr:hypothetical protein E2562_034125 [Oryza meyeriana var. granulata]